MTKKGKTLLPLFTTVFLDHLGIRYEKTQVEKTVSRYSFKNMKRIESSAKGVDYLTKNREIGFVRRGEKGQWKSELSAKHIEVIKEKYGSLLIELGYEKDFDWNES